MQRRGFTVLELVAAVTILVVLVAVALPTYDRVQAGGRDKAARSSLLGLEVELARIQAESDDGSFPANLASQVRAGGLDVVDGGRADGDVSVARLDASHAAAAITSDTGVCWVAVFTIDADPTWAADDNPVIEGCRAGNPAVTVGAVSGTEAEPTLLDL